MHAVNAKDCKWRHFCQRQLSGRNSEVGNKENHLVAGSQVQSTVHTVDFYWVLFVGFVVINVARQLLVVSHFSSACHSSNKCIFNWFTITFRQDCIQLREVIVVLYYAQSNKTCHRGDVG